MGSRWKRDKKNKENLQNWFGAEGKGHNALDLGTPEEMLKLIRMCAAHPDSVQNILGYARRFKQAVTEISAEDIKEVQDLLVVKKVLES